MKDKYQQFKAQQCDSFVHEILSMFEDPNKWPMTDAERIGFMRRIYVRAKAVKAAERETEKL